jgi:hypothetical protein
MFHMDRVQDGIPGIEQLPALGRDGHSHVPGGMARARRSLGASGKRISAGSW